MLRVWLPLTKDLRNQGLASLTSSGTPVFKNSGKLGGKSLDLNTRISFTCSALANLTTFSIAFWAKVNDDTSLSTDWVDIIGFTDATSSGTTGQLRWETCYSSSNKGRGISSHDNTTYAISNGFGKIFCNKNIWVHLTCTVDLANSSVKEYVNGEHLYTYATNGGHLTSAFWLGQTGVINGEIQDVRIYDHCLSPMEVKELSQGLVLHYPLNRGGWGQENLLLNSNDLTLWPIESSGKIELQEDGYFKVSSKASNTTRYGIYYDFTFPEPNTYTFSVDVRDDWLIGVAPASTFAWTTANLSGTQGKKRVSYTCTSTEENNKCRIYIAGTGTGGRVTYLKHPKFEKGSIATPWCPNSSDTLATTMGLNGTTEYDCSGFGNNGTRTGTFSWTSDTPKYAISTAIEKGIITSTNSFTTVADPIFSVALWFKLKSGITYTAYTDLISFSSSSYSNQPFRLEICGNPVGKSIMWFRGPSGQSGGFAVKSDLSTDTWYHTVLVSEGNKQYSYYVNGEKLGTYNGSANSWTPTGNVSLGENINGVLYESDFRIYATALSASDVLSLYQNSAYIDSSGNVYGTIHES